MRALRGLRSHAAYLAVALCVAGCEASFDPFEESDAAFSMFGYLDVAADTQVVRIGALQQTAFEPAPLEAAVVLEDLDRGARVALRDSLVRFPNGAAVNNVWAPVAVRPDTPYRLTATAPDGATASVTLRTPAAAAAPALSSGITQASSPENPPTAQGVTLPGVEKLADLRVTYTLDEPRTAVTISYLERAQRGADGTLRLGFNAYGDVQTALFGAPGVGCPSLQAAELFVATTTLAWPDFATLAPEVLALPGTASNVEGGLGFVGGVETRRLDWGGLVGVFGLHRAGCQ